MSVTARALIFLTGLAFALASLVNSSMNNPMFGLPCALFCITVSLSCLPGLLGHISRRILSALMFIMSIFLVKTESAARLSRLSEPTTFFSTILFLVLVGLPCAFFAVTGRSLLTAYAQKSVQRKPLTKQRDSSEISTFDTTLRTLEELAAQNPDLYKRKVTHLAAMGYAYIGSIALILIALLVGAIILFLRLPNGVVFQVLLVFASTAWLVTKSLWVKFNPPIGLTVSSEDAPLLFDLAKKVSKAAKSPTIHKLLITTDFNCAVVQVPRLGPFGLHENYLLLGLPLLLSLPLPQFEAILAHEMGHLSELHGKFGAWIYHLQATWLQIYKNLSNNSKVGTSLFDKFATWYVPKLEAHSMVLRRSQELEADQISKSLVGSKAAAQALVIVNVKGRYLEEHVWPKLYKQANYSAEPPKDILAACQTAITIPLTSDMIRKLILQSESARDIADSHPSLSERIHALGLPADINNLVDIYSNADFSAQQSAAEILLGASLPNITEFIETEIQKELSVGWEMCHAIFEDMTQKLQELDQRAESSTLSRNDAMDQALLAASTDDENRAIDLLKTLTQKEPTFAKALYKLGELLLARDDQSGFDYINKAKELSPFNSADCYAAIADYYTRNGNVTEAQLYRNKTKLLAEQIDEATQKYSELSLTDKFNEHTLPSERLSELSSAIHTQRLIEKAWLVERELPAILGRREHVLIVKLKHGLTTKDETEIQNASEFVLSAVLNVSEMPQGRVETWQWIKTNLGKACKTYENACIYDRKTWAHNHSNQINAQAVS